MAPCIFAKCKGIQISEFVQKLGNVGVALESISEKHLESYSSRLSILSKFRCFWLRGQQTWMSPPALSMGVSEH